MRPLRLLSIVLVAAGLAGGWWYYEHERAEAAAEEPRTAVVTRGDIEETVTAQGKVEARDFVDVGAQVSGQLMAVHAELGDEVQAGQLIAEIDPRVYQARVSAARAELETLRAQLAEQRAQARLARQVLDRSRRLVEADAVSVEAVQQAEAELAVAEARAKSIAAGIAQAQSQLDGDETNLGFTRIHAPMSGTVVVQTSRAGQTLNANQLAPVILQIANLDTMTVRAQVAEADVMRLAPGMEVYFTTLGALDRRWQGTVRQILPTPEVINDVVLFNALIDVDNRDHQLLPGMSTQMFFVLGRAKDVPLVPQAALGRRLPEADDARGRAHAAEVLTPTGIETRTVFVGLQTRRQAEVRAGLAEGERVVLREAAAVAGAGTFRLPPRI